MHEPPLYTSSGLRCVNFRPPPFFVNLELIQRVMHAVDFFLQTPNSGRDTQMGVL